MFKKMKKTANKLDLTNMNVTLNLSNDLEVNRQIRIIDLTKDDLRYMKYLYPFIEENILPIVDDFYKALEIEPSLQRIIDSHSSTDRLKVTLRRHLLEMFEGNLDKNYIAKRIQIAKVHVHIGLQTKWYIAAFQEISTSFFDIAKKVIKEPEDLIKALGAISKIINLEQQLVLESFESQEQENIEKEINIRMKAMEQVSDRSEELAGIAEETNASFEELMNQSKSIGELAKKGKKVSDLAGEVALEGKSKIDEQAVNMSNIVKSVQHIRNDVNNLINITNEMEKVTKIIKKVADDTHMLSINAQIEAAHAGEKGRGFSVVATNVGVLSEQTKESVKNVTELIKNIHKQSDKVHSSLETILLEANNGEVSMGQTTKQFQKVSDFLDQTKNHNIKIESELSNFVQVIQELGNAFEEVSSTADQLSILSQELR